MKSLVVKRAEKNLLLLGSSPYWKMYDFTVFLAFILLLDFQVRSFVPRDALFIEKFSFFGRFLFSRISSLAIFETVRFLAPLAVLAFSMTSFITWRQCRFDAGTGFLILDTTCLFIRLEKRELAIEEIHRIVLERLSGKKFALQIEMKSGLKITIDRSTSKISLRSTARKIQEVTGLPLNQKI